MIKKEPKKSDDEKPDDNETIFYVLVGIDGALFLCNLVSLSLFTRYLFKQSFESKSSYSDSYLERSKLVMAMNIIIIKDLMHTVFLVGVMIAILGYLAVFTAPVPILILVIKLGW